MPCWSSGIVKETKTMVAFLATQQSSKFVWWHCHECPEGKMHRWQAHPYSRNCGNRVSGCPCCVGQKVCECSCLENVCPDVAVDFDIDKNGVSPAGGQVQQPASTADCQRSLELRSVLWLSAHPTASNLTLLLEAADIWYSSQHCSYCVMDIRGVC